MNEDRRINKRINVSLPIDYETLEATGKKYGNAICKDISENGIKIVCDEFSPQKSKFLIKPNANLHGLS